MRYILLRIHTHTQRDTVGNTRKEHENMKSAAMAKTISYLCKNDKITFCAFLFYRSTERAVLLPCRAVLCKCLCTDVCVCVCMEDNIRLQYVWVRANNSNNYLQLRLSVSFKLDWSVERFVSAFYAFHIHSEATCFEWNSNAYTNARPEQLAVLAVRFALSLITFSLSHNTPHTGSCRCCCCCCRLCQVQRWWEWVPTRSRITTSWHTGEKLLRFCEIMAIIKD